MPLKIVLLGDKDSFNTHIAEEFIDLVKAVQSQGEDIRIILGGGKTPIDVNERIVHYTSNSKVDWSRIVIFFSDERCVPPDHSDSNYKMVRKTLLEPLKIPGKNVFRIEGELGPERAAMKYEKKIARVLGEGLESVFELALLGMGADGHTASLFPGSKAIKETKRFAVPAGKGPEGHERVTLTYPLLNRCKEVWFMIRGKEKQSAVRRLIHGSFNPEKCPAQGISPADGELVYILGDGLNLTSSIS
ncbi:6-phosphogluconolactonase [Thermodesulfobacteriota bacterium]